jgi:hypothetical protein
MAKVVRTHTYAPPYEVNTYPECPFAGSRVLVGTRDETNHCNHPYRVAGYDFCCTNHCWNASCPFDPKVDGKL